MFFNILKTRGSRVLPVCILMTGGYGCIGSWVAREVVEGGGKVSILDLAEDASRLDLLLDNPTDKARVHHVAGDVSDPVAVREAVERVEATHLIHLAGLLGPSCQADPIRVARVNVLGALAVFEAAAASVGRVERVVYASSAAVHRTAGRDAVGLVGDEVRLAPDTHYGAFKVCNELNALRLLAPSWRPQDRPSALDRLRRGPRQRRHLRADQGHPRGRLPSSVSDQPRRACGPALRRRCCGHVPSGPFRPVRGGRGVQPPGRSCRSSRSSPS